MKAGKLQRENSWFRFLVCHVILKVRTDFKMAASM